LITFNDRQLVDGLMTPKTLPKTSTQEFFNRIGRLLPQGFGQMRVFRAQFLPEKLFVGAILFQRGICLGGLRFTQSLR
jgi:hypothetical protein